MTLKGHRDIIHHLCYTPNERYLVSSGSDHLVRIWEIPQDTGDYIDEDQSESYLRGECVHSAAIYSTSMLHYPSQDSLYLLTCCFDGYIRLWENDLKEGRCEALDKILLNDYERTSQKVYPTASTAAESYFIVGDSLGLIRIYDFNKERLLTQRCVIENEELLNDAIFCLNVLNKNHLIVQVSDNVIRHYELLGSKLRLNNEYTGAVFENDNTIINCAVSPDNKYLLAPSANGRPYLWDVFTGAQIDISHLNLSIKGKLTSCDWHNKYNLVAFSGFVPNCPIFVFGNVLGEAEIKMVATQII